MYVPVPAAWMALMVYTVMAAASFACLVWRHPVTGLAAKAAEMVFTAIALVTGSILGKPKWGA